MTKSAPTSTSTLLSSLRTLAGALAMFCVLAAIQCSTAQAQTYTVLHTFSGPDGGNAFAGLTQDVADNFYGTTEYGGPTNSHCNLGCGTVFKLMRRGTGWVLTTLYTFRGGSDSGYPQSRVVFGPDGSLYGTTNGHTTGTDAGTVFNLKPPATFCPSVSCPWTKAILYHFTGQSPDGNSPFGDLTFDRQGNIYGTTYYGGQYSYGTVYELVHVNGGWTESVLYSFNPQPEMVTDGAYPAGGVVFDNAGNLLGTTAAGGLFEIPSLYPGGYGVVFKLTPVNNGWTETVLYTFQDDGDGALPFAGLTPAVVGGQQTFYGTTAAGGTGSCSIAMISGCGTVFQVPDSTDYSFPAYQSGGAFGGPEAPVTVDAAGRFYGTTSADGAHGLGSVFELAPDSNGWTYTSLHDFSGTDGSSPFSNVVLDSSGNLYGTASEGAGTGCSGSGCGVIWMITP
jgi:uncharacterized repeat protein (TIGR03803 family)